MAPLIISLLQISLIMSVVAVALHLLMNTFSNSLSPKWKYYIWGIVLISFLIPFRPVILDPIVTVDVPDIGAVTPSAGDTVSENVTAGEATITPSFWSQIDIPMLILGIWIAGFVIFIAVVFIKHVRFMNAAKRWGDKIDSPETVKLVESTMEEMNIDSDIDVIRSKMVSVPMMAGVFKPVLFLPVYDLDEEELKYVIRHELVHYRKFDILIKFLSALANAVHWFNPLVYMMQRWIHTDCEVACDYEVTKSYEKDERIRYVETIIGVAKHEIKYKTVFSTNFYDGKKTMKKRLESVLTANKTRSALVITLVVVVIIACITAGSALAISPEKEASNGNPTANNSSSNNESSGSNNSDGASDLNNNSDNTSSSTISASKAESIALDSVGGGSVTQCELDTDDGVKVYEVSVTYNGYEYDIDIDAISGKIIKNEKEKIDSDDD